MSAASAIVSCMSAMPWPVEPVAARGAGGGGAERHVGALDLGVGVDEHAADARELRANESSSPVNGSIG